MDLLDALSSNEKANSIVELCLSPLFRRHYSALYKTIVQFFQPSKPELAGEEKDIFQQSLLKALAPLIPEPTHRKFHLFGLDTTPIPRPFAKTLEDRTYIHQPNTIKGYKPINIGHLYSLFSFLPERARNGKTCLASDVVNCERATTTGINAIGLLSGLSTTI
jgi:hypothetical protein